MKNDKKPTPIQLCVGRAIVDSLFREDVFNTHNSPEEIAIKYGVPEAGVQALHDHESKELETVIEGLAEHVDKMVRIKFPAV